MDQFFRLIKKVLPKRLFSLFQPIYHYKLALIGAFIYRFPSRKIKVVGITGTKGKTTTAELVSSILEEAGHKTALMGTLRFKIAESEERNLYKMTMPGRFFVQYFLRRAVAAGCEWAVLEMTSEGVKQFRHKFIDLDALIFLNLAPEHIESHGSLERYVAAKFELAKSLEHSSKRPRAIVTNIDDALGEKFRGVSVENKKTFSLTDARPHTIGESGNVFTFKNTVIKTNLVGEFNIRNCLAAAVFAESQHIGVETIRKGLEKIKMVRGRVEFVEMGPFGSAQGKPLDKTRGKPFDDAQGKQPFKVVVDYAHTPDSLEALYKAFKVPALRLAPKIQEGLTQGENSYERKLICVLGNTGGGRDIWKRPEMGKIADAYCDEIILTNEDPYDEDPRKIISDMEKGFSKHKPLIILDRREAIREALRLASYQSEKLAQDGNEHNKIVVLITGKGTDPYIMGPNGSKIMWDDASVVREELKKLLASS